MKTLTTAQKIATAPTYGRLPYAAVLAHVALLPQETTAAERGPEWMAEYGCTPNCVMDHSQRENNPGWHKGPQVDMPAPARLDGLCSDDPDEPLIEACVATSNDLPEIFGVSTKLWVTVAGDTMELSLSETDQFISGLETLLPKLRALRAQLAEVSRSDQPLDEAAAAEWRIKEKARCAAIDAAREAAEIAARAAAE